MAIAPKTYRPNPKAKAKPYQPKGKQSDSFYRTAVWQRVRKYVLAKQPTCVACKGMAQCVDHIVPIAEGGAKTRLDNLQALCNSCHSQKTRKDNR